MLKEGREYKDIEMDIVYKMHQDGFVINCDGDHMRGKLGVDDID